MTYIVSSGALNSTPTNQADPRDTSFRQRVIFKTAVLVWKCLHDAAPRYLADLCVLAASTDGRRQSRSAVSAVLLVPWTRTSTGQHGFAGYDPRTWNRLPTALGSPELSLASFKRQLKTHSCVPALDSAGCSCGCRVPSSHRRCCDCTASSAPTTNLQTRLDEDVMSQLATLG